MDTGGKLEVILPIQLLLSRLIRTMAFEVMISQNSVHHIIWYEMKWLAYFSIRLPNKGHVINFILY